MIAYRHIAPSTPASLPYMLLQPAFQAVPESLRAHRKEAAQYAAAAAVSAQLPVDTAETRTCWVCNVVPHRVAMYYHGEPVCSCCTDWFL